MSSRNQDIVELARQHETLHAQIDDFTARLLDPARRDSAGDSLRELLMAIGMHFGYEESVMESAGYPHFEHHRRQHMAIMIEIGLLLERIDEADAASQAARGADFIKLWLNQHADHSDRDLESWLGQDS